MPQLQTRDLSDKALEHIEKAHAAISPGYESAISNYRLQKKNFLSNLNIELDKEADDFLNEINREVYSQMNTVIDTDLNEIYKMIEKDVSEQYEKWILEGNKNLQELEQKCKNAIAKQRKSKYGEAGNIDNLAKSLKDDINKFLNTNYKTQQELANYISSTVSLGRTSNIDIQRNLFGYARRLMLQKLKGQEINLKTQKFKTSLKGYYQEEVIVPLLEKMIAKKTGNISALPGGSLKNEKQEEIEMDILIVKKNNKSPKTFDKLIERLESIETLSEVSTSLGLEVIGGIQSKSWTAPWEKDMNPNGNMWNLSFGHHKELMPTGEDKHYWHAGVYNVMKNLTKAVGPKNFLFATGNAIYFTEDLLNKFRARNYVLAFTFSKREGKISDTKVTAQDHADL